MKKIANWVKKNKIEILGSIVVGLAAVFLFSTATSVAAQGDVRNHVIRLHILAHDNSPLEQDLKYLMRDEIWALVSELVEDAANMDAAREIIAQNIGHIEDAAWDLLQALGSGHAVNVRLTSSLPFPAMTYASVFLPQGQYEALQIIIGDGGGENWWCIMFPPMCLMHITRGRIVEQTDTSNITLRPRLRLFR